MKHINRIICIVTAVFLIIPAAMNIFVIRNMKAGYGREYRVELNRVKQNIDLSVEAQTTVPSCIEKDLNESGYEYITGVEWAAQNAPAEELDEFFNETEYDYVIHSSGNYYFKIKYNVEQKIDRKIIVIMNIAVIVAEITALFILFFVRNRILKPFNRISDLPYEISKGNLTAPIKEESGKFFGKFIWGLNLLRENIEERKRMELELQKDKKMLLLSLSHDIKTPLSTIKLYSRAISANLYNNAEKNKELSAGIDKKVDEIEYYISEIGRASREDFLLFEVHNEDLYIRDLFDRIKLYYTEKLAIANISFEVMNYDNVLVHGDIDRLYEVMQNIIENAVKYGDGRRIIINTEYDEECIVIRTANTGSQIENKEINHIFESFYRGSNSDNKSGSGLGLYIARQLMHLMDGEITAGYEGGDFTVSVYVKLSD